MLNLHVAKANDELPTGLFAISLLCDSSSFTQLISAPLFQISLNE